MPSLRTCSAKYAAHGVGFSGRRADASSFCPLPSPEPLLAALGVFTIDTHGEYRRAIRETWLRAAPAARIAARFVMHGLGARVELLEEAHRHRDTIFVRAQAEMSCKSAPLRKLLLWLACAPAAWPAASLVGKADDDLWVHLPGVALHVSRSLAALEATGPPQISGVVWGMIESYHWHEGIHRPVGFTGMRWAYRLLPGAGKLEKCRRRSAPQLLPGRNDVPKWWLSSMDVGTDGVGNVTGPFWFAQGPLYLLSGHLAAQVVASEWVQHEADAAARSGDADPTAPEPTWPWEDVFLGAALAHAARGERLAAIHVGSTGRPGIFSWEWGVRAAPSTLVWHMRLKNPERIRVLEEWASKNPERCDLAFDRLDCRTYVSCATAQWDACEPRLRGNCSTRLKDVPPSRLRPRGTEGARRRTNRARVRLAASET
tara:strand:- start:632 stop:1918 length:1287 start_codon:yes stop_codon:yes gene_type:complete